ncbi:hypothetical protein L210DRAFT_3659488 [Boletus edulis BED1]|uniref:BHLH domain-containing protein n=1 Tax=Boletus edulis BED1 TaxID=1328754 RepID=A0AAD4G4V4_BOLED|nr:hypothetical protein L210DRAFT_3659488 [Boletus edulis BED1]
MSNNPQYPYGVSTMACLSSSSPRLDFNTLNLTNTIVVLIPFPIMASPPIRHQHIELEQRCRDGYRPLEDTLPVFNQKSSKVSWTLLNHATTYIKYLEMTAAPPIHQSLNLPPLVFSILNRMIWCVFVKSEFLEIE